MGKLVIKKRISLDFLGEEYKEAYITYRSIPVMDFKDITTQIQDVSDDNMKAISFMVDTLKRYFIEGKFPGDDGLIDLTADDLQDLDSETTIKCFEVLSGQAIDPKVEAPLTKPSTTEASTSA